MVALVMTPPPWYRQLWPWLLMLMPATALFGGIFTFWLAATTNNAMVVDDYYREGKAINQQLARDTRAAALGLGATLSRSPDGTARIELSALPGTALPPALTLRVVHATRAELDQLIRLNAAGDGRYTASVGQLPREGRWNLMIEEPANTWRLTATVTRFDQPVMFKSQP
ncbi:MAG TPA: FixH family protein [Burkholderiaceae bacterium]|jgi:hypothetical protein|nr:FixH family protein [Burkholderiaceae bacterium]